MKGASIGFHNVQAPTLLGTLQWVNFSIPLGIYRGEVLRA